MDLTADPSHYHTCKSNPASVLPLHPEPSRRNGIRHFNHIPSLRRIRDVQPKKFSNIIRLPGRSKYRSASAFAGPMLWRDHVFKTKSGDGRFPQFHSDMLPEQSMPQVVDEIEQAITREERALDNLHLIRKMKRAILPTKGCILVRPGPPTVPLPYPYPPHLPAVVATSPRGAVSNPTPTGYLTPVIEPQATPPFTIALERIISVACSIGIAIAVLSVWIFRREIVICGSISMGIFGVFKFGQWYTEATRYDQKLIQQGNLAPAQMAAQTYVAKPQLPIPPSISQTYQQFLPGGW